MEGRGVGSPGCVVHVHVYGDWVMLWIAVDILSIADMVCLVRT